MRVTLESTSQVVDMDGVKARVWEGKTDSGIPFTAFIVRIAVDEKDNWKQFAEELHSERAPTVSWPLRMVL